MSFSSSNWLNCLSLSSVSCHPKGFANSFRRIGNRRYILTEDLYCWEIFLNIRSVLGVLLMDHFRDVTYQTLSPKLYQTRTRSCVAILCAMLKVLSQEARNENKTIARLFDNFIVLFVTLLQCSGEREAHRMPTVQLSILST